MRPLDGYTVIAVEQAVAAPLATRNLTDLGARVIKVENPGRGDLARGYDHVVEGTGAHFVWLNRGKESIAIDLKTPEGYAAIRRLIDTADVFLQNLAPGTAERLGLDAAELRAARPELVVVNISGFGVGGPMSLRKSYDLLIQAESGLISVTGTPETAVKTGIPTADIASGMYCAQAVLAALLRRARTGVGATIEVSMLEATIEWMAHAIYTQIYTGGQPPRMELGHIAIAPYNSFPTRDGSILIGVQTDEAWRTLVGDVFDRPELADDPRFTDNIARVRHRAECDASVAACTSGWSTAELDDALYRAGIPAAQIKTLEQVVDHPQLAARDRWRQVGTEHAVVPALLPPATFSDVQASMGDVPALGEHTRRLLLESGLEETEAEDLITRGVAAQSSLTQAAR